MRVPIPKVPDPFVNTNLLSLGPGADGVERFWISTYNDNVGCLGALVAEDGRHRLYRFPDHGGFYSAAQEDADTIWLCGTLSHVVRLTLSTGRYEVLATGIPWTLVFQGMVLDRATGKLFAAAFPQRTMRTTAFSYDLRNRRLVTVHEIDCPAHYMRASFANGDGSYSVVLHCPGETLLRWDPQAETVDYREYKQHLDVEVMNAGTTYHLIADDAGRRYFPDVGWYHPATRVFEDGPQPAREMTWFARRGNCAWGANYEGSTLTVGSWDLATGVVHDLCAIPDSQLHNANLTASGKVVAVNQLGTFYRFDGETGALEMTRRLPTGSWGHMNCLRRIDDDRLLGTPYITQRFWEVNLRTGEGRDCGRAAPGTGEVLQTWKIGRKIYLACYTGAELLEYDPAEHPHFPENPRVVADPPHGMRPVAGTDDGRNIYYACSMEYGLLGTSLVEYDTRTGATRYVAKPLGDQQIWSLWYHRPSHGLVCATTMHADCRSCPPTDDRCYFAVLDAETLEPRAKVPAPAGTEGARILGPLGNDQYLAACELTGGQRLFTLDLVDFNVPEAGQMTPLPRGCQRIVPTDRPGCFVLHVGRRLELWDMRRPERLRVLFDQYCNCRGYYVQGDSLYVMKPKVMIILEGVLKGRLRLHGGYRSIHPRALG
ncbi:MAG: NHL repeat-containing protein [Armatimonadota bacterium]